jgi:hypothetical protein
MSPSSSVLLYPCPSNIISCYGEIHSVIISICFIIQSFFFPFKVQKNVSFHDITSEMTCLFQGRQVAILATCWNSVIHSTSILSLIPVEPVQNWQIKNLRYNIFRYKIQCYFQIISDQYNFFLLYQFQTISNPLYRFVFVFTDWNDMKLSISQWNRWKIEIMFWENDMKQSIWYLKISIYDCLYSKFHLNIQFKSVLFRESSFSYHIVSYRIVSISNCIYQFLVRILKSRPCLSPNCFKLQGKFFRGPEKITLG